MIYNNCRVGIETKHPISLIVYGLLECFFLYWAYFGLNILFNLLASCSCLLGYKWLYVLSVVSISSWPRRSWITKGLTPISINKDAWLCLKSCVRISLTPVFRAAVFNRRLTLLFEAGKISMSSETLYKVSI